MDNYLDDAKDSKNISTSVNDGWIVAPPFLWFYACGKACLALLYCSCALWYCGLLYAKHMYFRIFNPCYDVLNYGQKDEEYMGL